MESLILNTIIAGLAVLTPVITAMIQNRHNRKIQEQNFISEHKIKAIEDYLSHIGRFVFDDWKEGETVSKGISTIFMYAPKELHDKIQQMNEKVLEIKSSRSGNYPYEKYAEARKMYIELCKDFELITNVKNWHKRI